MYDLTETRNWWYVQNEVFHTVYQKINTFTVKEGKKFMTEDGKQVVVPNEMVYDKTFSDKEIAGYVLANLK